MCVGLPNRLKDHRTYRFTSKPETQVISPIIVAQPREWLRHVDIEQTNWPNGREDASKFKRGVELALKRDFPASDLLYDYSFADRFLEDLAKETKYRAQVFNRIAKRLTMTAASARADGQLQDEFLSGRNEYRFRVTPRPSSTRIHYNVGAHNHLTFLRFYGEGAHDDGL
jgi:hypothetical protein